MKIDFLPRSGVNQYISEYDAIKYLDEVLENFKKPVVVTGCKSFDVFSKYYNGKYSFNVIRYDETASLEDMNRISKLVEENTDVVIAIGGGRVLDTAKGVADLLNIDYITIPTVLATCACISPVAAVYHPDYSFRQVDYYNRSAYCCIVDLNLLLNDSPVDYFVAGIGDTLAKWYEAIVLVENTDKMNDPLIKFGIEAAKITRDVLLKESKEALSNMSAKKYTQSFKYCVDTIFIISASVGGFAVEYGRMSGAHSIHNGLSLIKETHNILHGNKVAYGILVQLVAEDKIDEVKNLIKFYKENKLPYSLECINIVNNIDDKIQKIAEFSASEKETFRYVIKDVTPKIIENAIYKLEQIVKEN